jgi:catechol 2,3-dioxygenase-like lactoylglutathione lyase family enzyme
LLVLDIAHRFYNTGNVVHSKEAVVKRFHVHVAVNDLEKSIRFYSAMFGSEPTVLKPDYAKWMLDDPRVNFAISQRTRASGINHLGMQAETDTELEDIHARLRQADGTIVAEKGVACCYARSDKYWITDPEGIAWESFRSLGSVPIYGEDHDAAPAACGSAEETACRASTSPAVPAAKTAGCCSAG